MWPFIVVFFGIVPGVLVWCLVLLVRDFKRSRWLELSGINSKAEIIKRRTSLYTGPQFFFITYRFQAGNQVYTQQQRVTWRTYKRLIDVLDVTVRYAPDNPAFSRLSGQYTDHLDRLYLVFFSLSIAIIWLGLMFTFIRALQG
ncbi:MAG: hypothetical protein IT324_00610 [Anaerolineae bacterium]|nr:hypothetical protein [Anaerolineae bacterium]